MNSPLYFLHLTKTAGGSLKEAFKNSNRQVQFHYIHEEGFQRDFSYPEDIDVIFGHYVFGAHRNKHHVARYGCFLRDPIERTISHFYHLFNNDPGPVGEKARAAKNINAFLLESGHWEFDNFMCRVISGRGNKLKWGDAGYNVYAEARTNLLNHFEFVGIFEEMETSLSRLGAILPGLNMDLPVVNKGQYSKEVPLETREIIASLNCFDTLLYNEAKKQTTKPKQLEEQH